MLEAVRLGYLVCRDIKSAILGYDIGEKEWMEIVTKT